MERFWSKVDRTGECWLWTAARNRDGYGVFSYRGQMLLAHRVCLELTTGVAPAGLVLHTCDTPSCVRPDHLYAGTPADNSRDAVVRGRASGGRLGGRRTLAHADVEAIREGALMLSQYRLAELFGVSREYIGQILRGQRRVAVGA